MEINFICERMFDMSVIKVTNTATSEIVKEINMKRSKVISDMIENVNDYLYTWKELNSHAREKLLLKWSELIKKYQAEIAELMTRENGKPLSESMGEVI